MTKIKYNGYDYETKRDFLTGGQVANLITEAIKIYIGGGMLEGYAFNPVDMEINFYAGLFYLTIEGYDDIKDNNKFEELFSHGVHKNLLKDIENAQLAYDLMWKTAKELSNSVGIILQKISKFLDKLPQGEDLNALVDKLPDEWKKVKEEYDNIIGKNIANNTEGEKD